MSSRKTSLLVALSLITTIGLGLGIPWAAATSIRQEAQSAARAAGVEIDPVYVERCAGCHGPDGRGGARAPSLVARLGSRQEFRRVLSDGTGDMPPVPAIDDARTDALYDYVSALTASR